MMQLWLRGSGSLRRLWVDHQRPILTFQARKTLKKGRLRASPCPVVLPPTVVSQKVGVRLSLFAKSKLPRQTCCQRITRFPTTSPVTLSPASVAVLNDPVGSDSVISTVLGSSGPTLHELLCLASETPNHGRQRDHLKLTNLLSLYTANRLLPSTIQSQLIA